MKKKNTKVVKIISGFLWIFLWKADMIKLLRNYENQKKVSPNEFRSTDLCYSGRIHSSGFPPKIFVIIIK